MRASRRESASEPRSTRSHGFLALSFTLSLAASIVAGAGVAHGTRSVSVDVAEVDPGNATLHVRALVAGDTVEVRADAPCTTSKLQEQARRRSASYTFLRRPPRRASRSASS